MNNNLEKTKVEEKKNTQFVQVRIEMTCFILQILKEKNDNVVYNNGFYFYEDSHWQLKEKIYVKNFLRDFAEELGIPEKEYKSYKKAHDLYEQAKLDLYKELETNRDVLNFPNGTYDLNTLEFREHRKEDFLKYVLPYNYDSNATCPRWINFINEILPEQDLRKLIQEVLAYPLSNLHLEKIIYLYGSGRNGKSLTLDVVGSALGENNVSNVSLGYILKNDGLGIQQMENKLINISAENLPKISDSSVLKTYTSGESMTVKKLYQDIYSTKNYPQTILASNHLPQSSDYSFGFYSRLFIFPFNYTIPADKINPNLKQELCEELPGICNWLLDGVKYLRENKKFSDSQTIEALKNEYRIESDTVCSFMEEKMYTPSNSKKKLLKEIHNEFNRFCDENNYHQISTKTLSSRLKGLGYKIERLTGNKNFVWCEVRGINEIEFPEELDIPENNSKPIEENDLFGEESDLDF